jgi:amino-acid N-acetyltransferase
VRELDLAEAQALLAAGAGRARMPEALRAALAGSVAAVAGGVRRAHLLERGMDGALLKELFTRDGVGTLITADGFEQTRPATIDDVGGILALIVPLEAAGVLVPRPRERLETEIGSFTVMDRDGAVIACAALHPFPEERVAELACLAVHPDYAKAGRGDGLLVRMERQAVRQGARRLFVLTTQTAHWFQERGFETAKVADLPVRRQAMLNYQRGAKVYVKELKAERGSRAAG